MATAETVTTAIHNLLHATYAISEEEARTGVYTDRNADKEWEEALAEVANFPIHGGNRLYLRSAVGAAARGDGGAMRDHLAKAFN